MDDRNVIKVDYFSVESVEEHLATSIFRMTEDYIWYISESSENAFYFDSPNIDENPILHRGLILDFNAILCERLL